uniref:Inositol-1-monophosphatase n=1 Tax=Mola mola TaxID=94237 RepID=A0A3Q3XF00_MOLML
MADLWQNAMDHAVAAARRAGQVRVFIGEESVAAGEPCILTDDPTWIVDPIDGTTNFVHAGCRAVTWYSAVRSLLPQMEFGVVFSCLEDKMFTARRGSGAFCNGEPLQVSGQKDIQRSIIATEFGSNRDPEVVDKMFSSLRNVLCIPVHGIMRGAGTAAINMCLVASGCVEAYYEIGMHVWDLAASSLIVSEAGGVLMDVEGKDARASADGGDARRGAKSVRCACVFRRSGRSDVPTDRRSQQQNHR